MAVLTPFVYIVQDCTSCSTSTPSALQGLAHLAMGTGKMKSAA